MKRRMDEDPQEVNTQGKIWMGSRERQGEGRGKCRLKETPGFLSLFQERGSTGSGGKRRVSPKQMRGGKRIMGYANTIPPLLLILLFWQNVHISPPLNRERTLPRSRR